MRDIRETAIKIGVGVGLAGAMVAPAAIAEYLVWDSTQDAKQGVVEAYNVAEGANDRLASFLGGLEPECEEVVKNELVDGIPTKDALIMRNQALIDKGVCESDNTGLTTPLETASLLGLAVEEANEQLVKRERWVEKSHDVGSHVGSLVVAYMCAGAAYAGVWYYTS